MIFQLPFKTPSKKNSRVTDRRTGRSFPSEDYRKWHKAAVTWLKTHYKIEKIDGPVEIWLTFVHKDKRRKDSDNGTSSIFDLLVDVGILPDDCWTVITDHHVSNRYEKGVSSCSIKIERANSADSG